MGKKSENGTKENLAVSGFEDDVLFIFKMLVGRFQIQPKLNVQP